METGVRVPSCISGSFSKADDRPGFVPRPQIGRLRFLMLVFDRQFVSADTGRFVAFRLDVDAGLSYQDGIGVNMLDVYDAARSVGLITVAEGREVPNPEFIAEAKRLVLNRCKTCGIGERVQGDPHCWVCDVREERRFIAEAAATGRRASC